MTPTASAMKSGRPHFASIQMLRGIAALMVVIFHMVQAEVVHGAGDNLLNGTLANFGYAGVDLFFVISGFVMTTIASGSYQSPRNALRFLMRRAARILPLYYIFTALIVVLLVVRPSMVSERFQFADVVASFLLLPQRQHPLLQVGWTLTYEAFFYLVMAVAIATVKENRMPYFLVAWAFVILCGQFLIPSAPSVSVATSAMGWEFIAGAFVGLIHNRLRPGVSWTSVSLGVTLYWLSAELLLKAGIFSDGALMRSIAFGFPSALIVLGAVQLDRLGKSYAPMILQRIGDASYSLYLTHLFVLSFLARLWDWSQLNRSAWTHWAFFVIAGVSCVIVGNIVHIYMERPLSRLLSSRSSAHRLESEPAAEIRAPSAG